MNNADIVVLDNLSAHRNPEATRVIRDAGADLLFTPPHSPEFNPIERLWSKLTPRFSDAQRTACFIRRSHCILNLVEAFPPRQNGAGKPEPNTETESVTDTVARIRRSIRRRPAVAAAVSAAKLNGAISF